MWGVDRDDAAIAKVDDSAQGAGTGDGPAVEHRFECTDGFGRRGKPQDFPHFGLGHSFRNARPGLGRVPGLRLGRGRFVCYTVGDAIGRRQCRDSGARSSIQFLLEPDNSPLLLVDARSQALNLEFQLADAGRIVSPRKSGNCAHEQ